MQDPNLVFKIKVLAVAALKAASSWLRAETEWIRAHPKCIGCSCASSKDV